MLDLFVRYVVYPLWERRHGGQRLQFLQELTRTQWLTAEDLRQQQFERLQAILRYSVAHCPYYREQYQGLDLDQIKDWTAFKRLPILQKQTIREQGNRLLSDEYLPEQLIESRTGGSTGTALTVFFDQKCQELRNAAAMRSDRWAQWDIGMQVGAIWGNPPVARNLWEKLRSALLERTIYLDTMEINETSVRQFADNWQREQPQVLFGHAHSIFILATFVRRLGLQGLHPRGIIATSMMLLEPERKVIEEVFGCRVTNRYGCEEVGLIACECDQHQGMHINADHVIVEFLREDGSDAAAGEEGQIVVTDLVNHGMPLIRYMIGDLGVPSERRCACGRGLPLLERVVGRQADFLKRPNGSLVAGVSLVERTLTAIPGIEQMQLVQDRLDALCVNVVKSPQFTNETERALRDELGAVFGPQVSLDVRYVPELDRTRAGKYRFAICNV
jgi:phenylacetate-CoA ligase